MHDQLPSGLEAQLVEQWPSVPEVCPGFESHQDKEHFPSPMWANFLSRAATWDFIQQLNLPNLIHYVQYLCTIYNSP